MSSVNGNYVKVAARNDIAERKPRAVRVEEYKTLYKFKLQLISGIIKKIMLWRLTHEQI